MAKDNIIDFKSYQKKSKPSSKKKAKKKSSLVLDMVEKRQEIINAERRVVKRTILTEFIGACVVVPEKGLMKVAVYDISKTGIAFDVDIESGKFKTGDEISVRVYMNHQTYFAFDVKIKNSREISEEGVVRHGTGFLKDSPNQEALGYFVKFVESISASLKSDQGDVMVSGLRK